MDTRFVKVACSMMSGWICLLKFWFLQLSVSSTKGTEPFSWWPRPPKKRKSNKNWLIIFMRMSGKASVVLCKPKWKRTVCTCCMFECYLYIRHERVVPLFFLDVGLKEKNKIKTKRSQNYCKGQTLKYSCSKMNKCLCQLKKKLFMNRRNVA